MLLSLVILKYIIHTYMNNILLCINDICINGKIYMLIYNKHICINIYVLMIKYICLFNIFSTEF